MSIGLLGYYPEYNHKNMEFISFSSTQTVLEYDLLIIDLKYLFNEYVSSGEYNGFPRITDHDSARLKRDLEKRKREIKEFLESGKNIIIIGGSEDIVYCYSGNKSISGTGRNAKTTYYVDETRSSMILPIKINSLDLLGKNVNFVNKELENNLKKYNEYFQYRTIYEDVNEKNVLMTVKGTKKVVSFFEKVKNGYLIFLPDVVFNKTNPKQESKIEKQYYNDICNIVDILTKPKFELPAYSKKYLMPNEETMLDDIKNSKERLNKLKTDIENKEKILQKLQFEKIIFTGTGTPLELDSVDKFKSIGFSIEKYEEDSVDEDIVIKYNDRVAVVEVKGVSGSSNEKHTSQLVKWKSEYHIETGIFPKGILLVNAFNERELDKRQEYFPNQMLKYAEHQEICLLTTIQLYNIKQHLEVNPDDKDKIINQIFDTVGIFVGFEDWNIYIQKKEDL